MEYFWVTIIKQTIKQKKNKCPTILPIAFLPQHYYADDSFLTILILIFFITIKQKR